MYDYDFRGRVALNLVAAKVDFTEKGGKWLSHVQYAKGEKHEWEIAKSGDKFTAKVKTPHGTFKAKKTFDELEQAQRFATRFIDKAHGHELLEKALDKDFTKA